MTHQKPKNDQDAGNAKAPGKHILHLCLLLPEHQGTIIHAIARRESVFAQLRDSPPFSFDHILSEQFLGRSRLCSKTNAHPNRKKQPAIQHLALEQRKHEQTKPLRGFGSVWSASTYRAAYTVRFEGMVFMLHVFQKKVTAYYRQGDE